MALSITDLCVQAEAKVAALRAEKESLSSQKETLESTVATQAADIARARQTLELIIDIG